MAKNIFRIVSASCSLLFIVLRALTFVTPSTISATGFPKRSSSSLKVVAVSSIVSWRSPAQMVSASIFSLISVSPTARGWMM